MANTKVTSGVIKDDAVGADQLASNSVVTDSIVDNAITTAKINNDAILTAKISNSAITNAKMSANSVDSDQYVDGSIDTAHIGDGQITSAKLDTNIAVSGELTVGSHLNMGDNDILKIGAGSDLQIYHDGSDSFIDDSTGTGNLYVLSNQFLVNNANGTQNMGRFADGGAVTLYYAGAAKLATTSSGIDVTGTVVADGLTLSPEGSVITFDTSGTPDGRIKTGDNIKANSLQLESDNAVVINSGMDDGAASEVDGTFISRGSGFTKTALFDVNGDISFYNTAGTSQALFWDASAESLGIGTTSPEHALHVNGGAANTVAQFQSTDSNAYIEFLDSDAGASGCFIGGAGDDFVVLPNATEKFRVTSSGNVGIGTSSPSTPLHVYSNTSGVIATISGPNNYNSETGISLAVDRAKISGVLNGSGGSPGASLRFYTQPDSGSLTERMRIDSGGRVMIAETSNSGYSANADDLIVGDNGSATERGISIGSTVGGGIRWNDGADAGIIQYVHSSNAMQFYTANSLAATIDSSGRLLVDTTSLGNASTNAKVVCDSEFLARGSSAGFFWENRSGMTISAQGGWGGWYSTGTASHFLYSDGANRASIGRGTGIYTALSDVNKKKDFEDSTVGLAEVMQLQPKKFRMIDDADDAPKKLGFVAQDVENVIPEAYVEDLADDENEETFIGLTDRPIIAALTKAIQEQQTQIETLKAEIQELKG
jgi:hypothetical protein